MTRRAKILVVSLAAVGSLGLAAAAPPRLVWNATASAPEGLYWLQDHPPKVGDLVAVRPPRALADWLHTRGYLPNGAFLIKRLAAEPPSVVCRSGAWLSIDGRRVARVLWKDHVGRPLPVWSGCVTLARGQVLLLNDPARSLDGRYFGPIDRTAIAARAAPLWLLKES